MNAFGTAVSLLTASFATVRLDRVWYVVANVLSPVCPHQGQLVEARKVLP